MALILQRCVIELENREQIFGLKENDMTPGFPRYAISTVYCTHDGGELVLKQAWESSDRGDAVQNGMLACRNCQSTFPISEGILDLCDDSALDPESRHEHSLREKQYRAAVDVNEPVWCENSEMERAEITPTIEALQADGSQSLLELGCGDGRLTTALAHRFKSILAVDFSLEALRRLQMRVADRSNIALIRADISTLKICPGSFARALSTLVSNLPTLEHRNSMYRLAGKTVGANGRFVFSAHYHGFWPRAFGKKKSAYYEEGGIFRHNMTVKDCKSEAGHYFDDVKAWPIQIYLPLSRRMKLPLYRTSRALEHVPGLDSLGKLVLCTAEKPTL